MVNFTFWYSIICTEHGTGALGSAVDALDLQGRGISFPIIIQFKIILNYTRITLQLNR